MSLLTLLTEGYDLNCSRIKYVIVIVPAVSSDTALFAPWVVFQRLPVGTHIPIQKAFVLFTGLTDHDVLKSRTIMKLLVLPNGKVKGVQEYAFPL